MARIVDRPVIVETDEHGQPRAFTYRGRRYEVAEILDDWRELGPWWEQDPPEERTVYRVQVVGGGVAELDFRQPPGRWWLYKWWD